MALEIAHDVSSNLLIETDLLFTKFSKEGMDGIVCSGRRIACVYCQT